MGCIARSAVLAIGVTLSLVACSEQTADSGKPPAAAPSASASPTKLADPRSISIGEAEKLPSSRYQVMGKMPADLAPVAGKPQGIIGIKVIDRKVIGLAMNTTINWTLGDPASIISAEPRTGKIETLVRDDERTPGTGVDNVDINDRYVVWTDSTSADLYTAPWTLQSKNRENGKVSVLAKAPPGPGGTSPSRFYQGAYPTVYGDNVFMVGDSGEGGSDNNPVPSIYRVPIDGSGEMTEFIKGADQPRISGDTLMYHSGTSVRARNLRNGSERVIDPGLLDPEGRMWVFSENTFASVFETEDGTYSVHIERPDAAEAIITGLTSSPSARLFSSSRWMSFVIQDAESDDLPVNYLYDIDDHRLWVVNPGITYRSAQGSGPTFFYETQDNEAQDASYSLEMFELRE